MAYHQSRYKLAYIFSLLHELSFHFLTLTKSVSDISVLLVIFVSTLYTSEPGVGVSILGDSLCCEDLIRYLPSLLYLHNYPNLNSLNASRSFNSPLTAFPVPNVASLQSVLHPLV